MRKVIIIAISTLLATAGIVIVLVRPVDTQSPENHLLVAVLISERYYSSYEGRTIRTEFRRQRLNNERSQRLVYRFVKIDEQQGQLYAITQQLIAGGTEVIISFEPRFTDRLSQIASDFPAQRFYLSSTQRNSSNLNDNVYLISLELDTHNYLLGYFASLLMHYRFVNLPQAKTAIINVGDVVNSDDIRAVTFGLRSVAIENEYQYLTISAGLNREQIFNLFEKLKLDDTEIVILLTPTVGTRPFFRAAARNDIALITQAPRRYLRGAQVAQRVIHWPVIITTRLVPHMLHQRERNITITANDDYYSIRHRTRIRDADTAELVSTQFNKIIEKITLKKVNIGL